MDEIPMGPMVTAGSWAVAVRIVAAQPELRIYETHPGGGMYDCLSVAGPKVHIDINRAGSIHVHYSPGGQKTGLILPEEWKAALLTEGGSQRLADQVLEFCRLPVRHVAATPWLIMYRVIARALASRVFETVWWDARQQYDRWPVPSAEMGLIPANASWVLMHGESRVTWLWDGWAWTARGERLNLVAAYNGGARIDELAALITARPGKSGAPSLPEMPRYPDKQPIGEPWNSE